MDNKSSDTEQKICGRCGTCCIKGGPSLHLEDKELVQTGKIPLSKLVTLRKGEMASDNVSGGIKPLGAELIKIKGRGGSWACRFFDPGAKGCTIYENRPVECAAMQCWDTTGIAAIYDKDRITRKDLIGTVEGLWELVEDHEERCSWDEINRLAEEAVGNDDPRMTKIMEMINYDHSLRNVIVEKGMDKGMLEFLLGRPLASAVESLGMTIVKDGERYRLMKKETEQETCSCGKCSPDGK